MVSAQSSKMEYLVCRKRKLNTKTVLEKYKMLKEIEKGATAAAVARKYDIAKQTLSNWTKDKSKIYATVGANNSSIKR